MRAPPARFKEPSLTSSSSTLLAYDPVQMELTFTHYRILFDADSSNLPELLMSMKSSGSAEDFEWPALSLGEAREALLDLIRAGYVDLLGDKDKPLRKGEAIQALNNDAAWANNMPDTPEYFEIGITDKGAEAFERISPKFRKVGRLPRR